MLRITRARTPAPTSLFYFLVFGSRLFQDGDVRVGVFPERVAAADATNHTGETPAPTSLFYFFVFGSRFLQDGDVRVGIFLGSVAAADATNHTGEDAPTSLF